MISEHLTMIPPSACKKLNPHLKITKGLSHYLTDSGGTFLCHICADILMFFGAQWCSCYKASKKAVNMLCQNEVCQLTGSCKYWCSRENFITGRGMGLMSVAFEKERMVFRFQFYCKNNSCNVDSLELKPASHMWWWNSLFLPEGGDILLRSLSFSPSHNSSIKETAWGLQDSKGLFLQKPDSWSSSVLPLSTAACHISALWIVFTSESVKVISLLTIQTNVRLSAARLWFDHFGCVSFKEVEVFLLVVVPELRLFLFFIVLICQSSFRFYILLFNLIQSFSHLYRKDKCVCLLKVFETRTCGKRSWI